MSESSCSQVDMQEEIQTPNSTGCPMDGQYADQSSLEPEDMLCCPHHRRMVSEYVTTESGGQELHIYYGEKDITFDEPELFQFGESLAAHERFVARDATNWGAGYDWSRVRELLSQLLTGGILERSTANDSDRSEPFPMQEKARPSPLPPAQTSMPRTWVDCEAITSELTGRPLEVGYLESVIPIYRVAHIALDTEGRQVGEANVFPAQLRLDIPTEWRTCMYKGSRFQDHNPINVTALKSMKEHWKPTMVAVQRIREAYLRRFQKDRTGWTVGDLERLSAVVLTLPAFLLMRANNRVENGRLHPVLSSMFRVTDGVRMVMHYMLFIDVNEPTRPPDSPITSKEIFSYAERNAVFLSDHGVCAGPRVMIEEFLRILVDGESIEGAESVVLDDPLESALTSIEPAFDYALYGLQLHAIVFVLWNILTRTYEQLCAIVETWPAEKSEFFAKFRRRLYDAVTFMRTHSYIGTEESRMRRDQVFADMYAKSACGLGFSSSPTTLSERLTPVWEAHDGEVLEQLCSLLQQRLCLGTAPENSAIESLAGCVMDYLRQERAVVRAAWEIQQRINHLLGRSSPGRPLTGWDLYIYYELQEARRRPPYLLAVLKEEIGVRINITHDTIQITDSMTG